MLLLWGVDQGKSLRLGRQASQYMTVSNGIRQI